MTQTDLTHLNWGRLKQDIPHLDSVSADGWTLTWGDAFEIVCKKASAMQVKRLDDLVTNALPRAAELLQ